MGLPVKDRSIKHRQILQPDFEDIYLAVRQKESRIYTDAQLRLLPCSDHLFSDEWQVRKRSSDRLKTYLENKRKRLKILEVGCGNGWLSAKLSDIPQSRVTGLDINQVEIEQAKRVFQKDNLEFIYDSFNDNTFDNERFDIIIFAASLQYFPSVINVLKQALGMLKQGGEVHIIDTRFCNPLEAEEADAQSYKYYAGLGYPEMARYYFHHSISEFWGFKYKILSNPSNVFNRLFTKDPYYWISVRK